MEVVATTSDRLGNGIDCVERAVRGPIDRNVWRHPHQDKPDQRRTAGS